MVLEALLENSLFEEITQTGTINREWYGSAKTENVTVQFGKTFAKTPVVTASTTSKGCTATVVSVSLSSCIIACYHNGNHDGKMSWNWTAVGLVTK